MTTQDRYKTPKKEQPARQLDGTQELPKRPPLNLDSREAQQTIERVSSISKLGELAQEGGRADPQTLDSSFKTLSKAAKDKDPLVRAEAVWAIGEYGSERGLGVLETCLAADPDPIVRENAVFALGKIGTNAILNPMRTAVRDGDPGVRAAAVEVLGDAMRSTFGRLVTPDMAVRRDIFGETKDYGPSLDNGGSILAETALDVDEFGAIRLKAALRLNETGNEQALARLKEEIKRGGPIKINLGGLPIGERSVELGEDYVKVTDVDGKISTHAESEAGAVLRDISRKLGGFVSPRELQEMIEVGAIVEAGSGRLSKVHSIVSSIVREWNRKFAESIDMPPTNRKLLCAFTSNVDAICYLRDSASAQKKVDKALEDAVQEGAEMGRTREQVTEEIETIINDPDKKKLPKKVTTKSQALGFILRVFKTPGGKQAIDDRLDESGKPIPGTGKALADWIRDTFKPEYRKLGGASAQMADFMAGISENNVAVYTQYHSQGQAEAYQMSPKFMRIMDGRPSAHKIDDPESVVAESPTKENYPVEVMPSIAVKLNGKRLQSREMQDRVIFTTEYYDSQGKAYDFVPLFEFTDDVLHQIGREYQYFIINGPHYLQRYPKEKYDRIAPQMKHQLETLAKAGVKVHFEFSGETSGVPYLRDVIRGNLASIGINHTEVTPLAESMKTELDGGLTVATGDDMHAAYLNGLQIARYLGVERLYIHGHNMDLTIRRSPSDADIDGEQRANLHAKQRVTEWLRGEESVYPTPEARKPEPLLKREGFQEMIAFAEQLAGDSGLEGNERLRFMRDAAVKGHARMGDHTVIFTPVKWIYGPTKVTTSSGDITSSTAYIHAPI